MGLSVGEVVELIRPHCAVRLGPVAFLRQSAGDAHVVAGIGVGRRIHLDQLCLEEAQGVLLLLRLGAGNDDRRPIAEGGRHSGQADAGVAGGSLDDQSPRTQPPRSLGAANDLQGRAVLHRAARIHELRLRPDLAAGPLTRALQPDQGGAAYGVDDAGGLHHGALAGTMDAYLG